MSDWNSLLTEVGRKRDAFPVRMVGEFDGGGNGESFIATETSAANTLATATKTAADKSLYITGYIVALRGAAAGNDVSVQVKDGSSILIQDYIGKDAPSGERIGAMLTHPIKCAGDAVLEVGAAGAGAITELTLMGYSL